jgi:hypothetical protein
MNASPGVISQRKIDLIVLFLELTSGSTYGWPRRPMIRWFVLRR